MKRIGLYAGGTCGSNVSPHISRLSRLTTSFGIIRDDEGIIVDNGHGVQNVVAWLRQQEPRSITMLQTHLHADHTDGLPQNAYLFQNKVPVRCYSAIHLDHTLSDVWEQRFAPHIWPVRPETFGSKLDFTIITPGSQVLDGIETMALDHPGGAVAYRIGHEFGDIVIATDHECGTPEIDLAYAEFVDGAAALVADVQYRQSEYEGKVGISGGPAMSRKSWGHSTEVSLARALAHCALPPRQIFVTHHDPQRAQADLTDFHVEIRRSLSTSEIDSECDGIDDRCACFMPSKVRAHT